MRKGIGAAQMMTSETILEFVKARLDGTKTPEEVSNELLLAIGLKAHFITPEIIKKTIGAQNNLITTLNGIKTQKLN